MYVREAKLWASDKVLISLTIPMRKTFVVLARGLSEWLMADVMPTQQHHGNSLRRLGPRLVLGASLAMCVRLGASRLQRDDSWCKVAGYSMYTLGMCKPRILQLYTNRRDNLRNLAKSIGTIGNSHASSSLFHGPYRM